MAFSRSIRLFEKIIIFKKNLNLLQAGVFFAFVDVSRYAIDLNICQHPTLDLIKQTHFVLCKNDIH